MARRPSAKASDQPRKQVVAEVCQFQLCRRWGTHGFGPPRWAREEHFCAEHAREFEERTKR